MTKITKLSELFKALEDGERVEYLHSHSADVWYEFKTWEWDFQELLDEVAPMPELRIAPKTAWIEGPGGRFEYPEPVRENDEVDDVYFWVVIGAVEKCCSSVIIKHDCDYTFDRRLRRGLVHLTEEAAKAHAEAIIKAMGGEV